VGFVKGARTMVAGAGAARATAASRLALFGMAETGAFTALERVNDPTIGTQDIAKWMGIGGAIGGLLGAAAPRAAFVQRVDLDQPSPAAARAAAEVAEEGVEAVEPAPASAGAAAAHIAATTAQDLPEGVGSVGRKVFRSETFRSPLQRIQNWLVDNPGNEAVQNLALNVYTKFNRLASATKGEQAGLTKRVNLSVQEVSDQLENERGKIEIAQHTTYRALQRDLGEGLMRVRLRMPIFKGGWPFPTPQAGVTRDELRKMGWQFSQAQNAGIDIQEYVARLGLDGLDDTSAKRLAKAIEESAEHDNAYFREWQKTLLEEGHLAPDEIEAGNYRPQQYNIDEILQDPDGFMDLLRENQGWNPPDEWLVQQGYIKQGQTLSDLPVDIQEEARLEAMISRREAMEGHADRAHAKAIETLEGAKGEAIHIVTARHEKKIAAVVEKIKKQEARLATGKDTDRTLRALAKSEQELADLEDAYKVALRALDSEEGIRSQLARIASTAAPAARKEAQKAAAALKKANLKAAKTEATAGRGMAERADLDATAKTIMDKITGASAAGHNAYGFMPGEDLLGVPGRLQVRNLDWTPSRIKNDPRLERFLLEDPSHAMAGYLRTVGSRVALKRVFGTDEPLEQLKANLEGLPLAIREEARKDIEFLLDQVTGRHLTKDIGLRQFSRSIMGINVATMLGNAGWSRLGDVALLQFARRSGHVNNFVKNFVTGPNRGIIRHLEDMGKNTLAALAHGADHIIDPSLRQARLLNFDGTQLVKGAGTPGTAQWKIMKRAQTGANLSATMMMRLNLMNLWDGRIASAFRLAFMADAIDSFRKPWSSLSKELREGFLSMGIDEADAARMAKLADEHSVTMPNGAKLPDIDNWPVADRNMFSRLIDQTAQEGRIAPTIGVQPRLVNSPIGAMFMQFTAFPYAAQQKFLRRGIQDPLSPVFLQSVMIATLFSAVADAGRHVTRGQGEEWAESWNTPEGVTQRMFNIYSRGPMSVAYSGSLMDQLLILGGRAGNETLENIGLGRPLPQPSRLRERNIFEGLGGPSVTTINRLGLLTATGAGAASGVQSDIDALPRQLQQTLPFASLWFVHAANAALGDED
jgi:hypothetical protein